MFLKTQLYTKESHESKLRIQQKTIGLLTNVSTEGACPYLSFNT